MASSPAQLAETQLPQRPQMPTQQDQDRSVHQAVRQSLLDENHEDVVIEWLKQHIDEENLAAWGPPDLSANPISDLSRQLTTPGLYGIRGDYRHPDASTASLIGPEGALAAAGWTTKMQRVQYLVLGMGDYFLRLDIPRGGRELTIRLVPPQDVYVETDPDAPDRPVKLWELRLRYWEAKGKWVYCWDQYDLGESREGRTPREPSWRVVLCAKPSALDDGDVSNVFLAKPGGFVGAEYPYRAADGSPVLPYVKYSAVDSGRMWNHLDKRGAARGTLNACLYWTYAGHAAKSASGKAIIVAGLVPMGEVQDSPNSNQRIRTARIMPGSLAYHDFVGGESGNVVVQEIGPGADVDKLAAFADHYEMKQAVRWGLDPADIMRQSANPSSGAALMISARGKRNFSRQVEEVFRRGDLEVIRLAAILMRAAGLGTYPETGYSVTYHELPDSPAEQADKRAGADWEIAHDFLSPEAAFIRWHPGVSEENATGAILGARLAKMRIEKQANDAAAVEGLSAPKAEAARMVGIEEIKRQYLADATAGLLLPDTVAEMLTDLGMDVVKVEAVLAPIRAKRGAIAQGVQAAGKPDVAESAQVVGNAPEPEEEPEP